MQGQSPAQPRAERSPGRPGRSPYPNSPHPVVMVVGVRAGVCPCRNRGSVMASVLSPPQKARGNSPALRGKGPVHPWARGRTVRWSGPPACTCVHTLAFTQAHTYSHRHTCRNAHTQPSHRRNVHRFSRNNQIRRICAQRHSHCDTVVRVGGRQPALLRKVRCLPRLAGSEPLRGLSSP